MKKRGVFFFAVLLIVATSLLLVAIFQLYKDAETVQKNIFAREVGRAGADIVTKIDQVLQGDTLPYIAPLTTSLDTAQTFLFQKHSKKFIFDPSRLQPVGVIHSTINYSRNSVELVSHDTIYFDTTRYKTLTPYPMPWETDLSAFVANQNIKKEKKGIDDLIEMDSNTVRLLNKDFLYRIIKESLLAQNISGDFDFALFNYFTTEFVVPPREPMTENILQKAFVFTLKPSDKFWATHYLMLYFPTERLILLKRNSFITVLIAIFVSIILLLFVFMLYMLYRQKRISDIKNDFINNMTHEFKTPLSTISLACEALSGDGMIKKANRDAFISIISDENERLKLMVSNILQLAQLKKGQLKLHVEPCNLHDLITSICDSFSLQITSANGEIREYLHATNYLLTVDKMHIQNVIINLIENGIKYSKENPKIAIRTENDKKNLLICISDNGIGMAKKSIKNIFNEFYRVYTGNVHNQKGQGLGLVYVKKIIDLHGGFISVKSELGKGTTFCIGLPIK